MDFFVEDIADMSTCERRLKLVNALDRFLLSRGDKKMKKFDLVWEGHNEVMRTMLMNNHASVSMRVSE